MANTPTTTVDLYYTPEMAVRNDPHGNFSKSPSKPRRFAEHLLKGPLSPHVRVERGFAPLTDAQLLTAHTPDYVEAFFAGEEPLASSNGLNWTAEFARSVRYTNGSLLAASAARARTPSASRFRRRAAFTTRGRTAAEGSAPSAARPSPRSTSTARRARAARGLTSTGTSATASRTRGASRRTSTRPSPSA